MMNEIFNIRGYYRENLDRIAINLNNNFYSNIWSFQEYYYLLNLILPDKELKEANLLYKSHVREYEQNPLQFDKPKYSGEYGKIAELLLNHDTFSLIIPTEWSNTGSVYLFNPLIVLYTKVDNLSGNIDGLKNIKIGHEYFEASLILDNSYNLSPKIYFGSNIIISDNLDPLMDSSFLSCRNIYLDLDEQLFQSEIFYIPNNSNEIVFPNFEQIKEKYKLCGKIYDYFNYNNLIIAHYDYHSDTRKSEVYERDSIMIDLSGNRIVFKESQKDVYRY